jgi:hypothetical protein
MRFLFIASLICSLQFNQVQNLLQRIAIVVSRTTIVRLIFFCKLLGQFYNNKVYKSPLDRYFEQSL